MYYLIAFASGLLNTMNRMTNVKAGRVFGTANGALINYGEATLISSVLMLAGNLGISVALDWFFYGNFHWVKILGIFLVLVGMTWIQKGKQTAQAEGLPAEG